MARDGMEYYLLQLENLPFEFYLWQEEQLEQHSCYRRFMKSIIPRDLGDVKCYNYSNLLEFTDHFSAENFIQKTFTGSLFRVKSGHVFNNREVTIKLWDFKLPIPSCCFFNLLKFHGELVYLSHDISQYTGIKPLSHPNLVKLIGYSFDKVPAIMYDLQSDKCLANEITSDSFDWKSRMDLAIQIGGLLLYIHGNGTAIKSITSRNIMIDKDGNPKLFANGLAVDVSGDSYGRALYFEGYCGYGVADDELNDMRRDIFMYGIMLMELLAKKVVGFQEIDDLVKRCRESVVGGEKFVEGLEVDDETAKKVSQLALECADPETANNSLVMIDVLQKLKGAVAATKD